MVSRSIFWVLIPALVAVHFCTHHATAQEPSPSQSSPARLPIQPQLNQPAGQPEHQASTIPPVEAERAKLLKQRDEHYDKSHKFHENGKFDEALEAAQKVLALERQIFGPDSDDAARSLSWIGTIHEALEHWDAAHQSRQDGLDMLIRLHGHDSWQVTDARLDLDHTVLLQNVSTEKRQQLRKADELRTRVHTLNDQVKYADAIPLAAERLKLLEAALGPVDDRLIADACSDLAILHDNLGNYSEALPLFQRTLDIRERILGASHPEIANALSDVAGLYREQGNYAQALPLFQRALEIREKILAPDDPDIAESLNSLAMLCEDRASYVEAQQLVERAIKIDEKSLGIDHPDLALFLNNLGRLCREQGNFADALPQFQRALKILEKAYGPDHPDVANNLNSIAFLYTEEGNDVEALPLFKRSLQIFEKTLGPDHPRLAYSLINLADLYRDQGNYAAALPLFQRAIKIREKALGPDHPDVATSLNSLAIMYRDQGNDAEALALYQRALKIREKALVPDHPDVAQSLNSLAQMYQMQGNFTEALPLFQRAEKIWEKTLGTDHPAVAINLSSLARLYQDQSNYAEALSRYERTAELMRRRLELTAAVQSERQQLEDIKSHRHHLDNLVSCALLSVADSLARASAGAPSTESSNADLSAAVYTQMLAWKGAVTLRQQLERAARHSDNPDEQKLWNDLQAVSTQLATASRATPNPQQHDAWQQKLTDFTKQKEQIEADLSQRSAEFRKLRSQTKLTSDDLAKKLPANTALVDLLQFYRSVDETQPDGSLTTYSVQHLAAFVIRSDQPVAMIDLGLIEPINAAVAKWRETYGGNVPSLSPEQQPSMNLRRLIWDPIAQHLGGIRTVLVSPDGEVARFPWSAVPGSKRNSYLIEDGIAIALIPVPQMLPDLLDAKKTNLDQIAPTLLVLGDVNYDAIAANPQSVHPNVKPRVPRTEQNELAMSEPRRSAVRGERVMVFGPLPGTAIEIQAIEEVYRARFSDSQPLELIESSATQQRLRDEAPNYRYLHLATHGFFAPPEVQSALQDSPLDAKGAASASTVASPTPQITANTVVGIGARLSVDQHKITVMELVPGGAAALDGRLSLGDQILALSSGDGQWTSLDGKTLDQAINLIRGPAGTNIRLRVQPAVGGKAAEYEFARMPVVVAQPTQPAPGQSQESQVTGFNPGLLSGIALAGANRGNLSESSSDPAAVAADDGIMTALEVASLDLQNVDLVTLSACETGLGKETGGEGMLGLQRAFQVAGAKATVSSLWSVDDAATQTMMTEFYSRLWNKDRPLGKLEALRQAQLEMLNHYDPNTKKIANGSRGLQLDAESSTTNGRLSPKYWAAFDLSGDWR
jgi:CHAT domain-containing protein/Tfp pilus assembly protein PilF